MSSPKILKVRGVSKPDKFGHVGIVAITLEKALQKGCDKLNIPRDDGTKICLETDGTLVTDEEYFQTLEKDTCLVVMERGQSWNGGFDMEARKLKEALAALSQNEYTDKIKELMQKEASTTMQFLADFVNSSPEMIQAEERDEDPEWFEGVDQRSKSLAMFVKAQERVRGYFSKTNEMLKNDGNAYNQAARERRTRVISDLRDKLKTNRFHGVYFERKSEHQDRLCNEKGWFRCEGPYDTDNCDYYHIINPYGNKNSRILFSTWNLDHVIEKSREVIRGLKEAILNCPKNKEVNVSYFYDLLFTRKNLKLVDIRCHIKGIHSGRVLKRHFYMPK